MSTVSLACAASLAMYPLQNSFRVFLYPVQCLRTHYPPIELVKRRRMNSAPHCGLSESVREGQQRGWFARMPLPVEARSNTHTQSPFTRRSTWDSKTELWFELELITRTLPTCCEFLFYRRLALRESHPHCMRVDDATRPFALLGRRTHQLRAHV